MKPNFNFGGSQSKSDLTIKKIIKLNKLNNN